MITISVTDGNETAFLIVRRAGEPTEERIAIPERLVEPFLELGRQLLSPSNAAAAMSRLRSALETRQNASSPSLRLGDFRRAALELGHDEQQGTRVLMALARYADRSPEQLQVTCSAENCGEHISQSCGHISPLWPDTTELLTVDTSSLIRVISRPTHQKVDGVGDKSMKIIDYLVGNR